MPKKNKLSKQIIDKWPEVLGNIDIKVVPTEYIKAVEVTFTDGKVWVIENDPAQSISDNAEAFEQSMEDLMDEYEDVLKSVNFVVDIERVKKDITKRTKIFMKKRK